MPAGIEIYDQNGKLQFNGDMLTYTLRVSGVAYVEARQVGNTSPRSLMLPTTNTFTGALVALSGGDGHAAAWAGSWGSTGQRIYATSAPVGTAFNYFVFESSNTIPASNFGLEVRNASNQITFSTAHRVMRITDLIQGVVYNGEQASTSPGRQLAFCQGNFGYHNFPYGVQYHPNGPGSGGVIDPTMPDDGSDPGGSGNYSMQIDGKLYGAFVTNGGQTIQTRALSYDDVYIAPQPTPPHDGVFIPVSMFVVDVTGVPIGQVFY